MLKLNDGMSLIRHAHPSLLTPIDDLEDRFLGDRVQPCARVQHDFSYQRTEPGSGVELTFSTLVLDHVPTGLGQIDQPAQDLRGPPGVG